MKKIFLVERTDGYDYEEYDSAVFIADNEEEIAEMICERDCNYWDYGKRKITEIDLENETSRELLSSFNAG